MSVVFRYHGVNLKVHTFNDKFCYVQEGLEAYTIILVFSRQPNVQCKHKLVINYWINWPISYHWSLSILPENIKKHLIFRVYRKSSAPSNES